MVEDDENPDRRTGECEAPGPHVPWCCCAWTVQRLRGRGDSMIAGAGHGRELGSGGWLSGSSKPRPGPRWASFTPKTPHDAAPRVGGHFLHFTRKETGLGKGRQAAPRPWRHAGPVCEPHATRAAPCAGAKRRGLQRSRTEPRGRPRAPGGGLRAASHACPRTELAAPSRSGARRPVTGERRRCPPRPRSPSCRQAPYLS